MAARAELRNALKHLRAHFIGRHGQPTVSDVQAVRTRSVVFLSCQDVALSWNCKPHASDLEKWHELAGSLLRICLSWPIILALDAGSDGLCVVRMMGHVCEMMLGRVGRHTPVCTVYGGGRQE